MEHHANHPSPSGIAPARPWWVNSRGIHPRRIRTGAGFEQVPFWARAAAPCCAGPVRCTGDPMEHGVASRGGTKMQRIGEAHAGLRAIESLGEQAGILDRDARQPRAGSECRRDLLPDTRPIAGLPWGDAACWRRSSSVHLCIRALPEQSHPVFLLVCRHPLRASRRSDGALDLCAAPPRRYQVPAILSGADSAPHRIASCRGR